MASNKTKQARKEAIASLPSVQLQLVVAADPALKTDGDKPLKNLVYNVTTLKGLVYAEGFVGFYELSNSPVYSGGSVWVMSPYGQVVIPRKTLLDELAMIKFFLKNGASLLQDVNERMFDQPILDSNFLGLVGKLYKPNAPQEVRASAASVKVMSKTLTQVEKRAAVIAKTQVEESALGKLNASMGNHSAVRRFEEAKAIQAADRKALKAAQKVLSI